MPLPGTRPGSDGGRVPLDALLAGVLVLAALTSSGLSLYLWRENRLLRAQLQEVASTMGGERFHEHQGPGTLPEFTARDAEGRDVHVAARGTRQILLIYDPACSRCEAALPAWKDLHARLQRGRSGAQVIALSVADSEITLDHARRVKLPFPAVAFPSRALVRSYGITEVPLTVVVDARGGVEAVWKNPLTQQEIADVVKTVCPDCVGG